MAQLFHSSANYIAKASLVGAVLLAAVGGFVYTIVARSSYLTGQYIERQQPVQFSHKHHVGDDGIDCRYCHTSVETSDTAGMPPTQTCMNCHSQLWADSPYLKPIRDSWAENKPIEWVRVHDLPEYAYFNHSIHVNKGVGCSTCHGDIANMAGIYQANTLQMEWCIQCHKDPTPNLRPKAEIFNTKFDPASQSEEERKTLHDNYKIRSRELMTSCSMCHR